MAKTNPQQSSKKKTMREKAEKQKKAAVKAVLQNPFKTLWPNISNEKQVEVLSYLERLLQPICDANVKDASVNPEIEKIRSEFVFGVNSVTRYLEKDKLALVLVCKSAHPPIIVKHLAELSAVRCCPAMLLGGLKNLLCSKLHLRSAVAIGFKKRVDGWFHEFVSTVNCPEINFPYLNNNVAKFIIDKKGKKLPGHFYCENTPVNRQPYMPHRQPAFSQNKTPATVPAQAGNSKFHAQKPVNKKNKREKNPFKSNENFISLGSVSEDEELKGLDLKLRHVNTRDSIWNEIFAMRIVDKLNSKGASVNRDDVDPFEISLLKSATLGNQATQMSRFVRGGKRERDWKGGFQRKNFKIWEEKPEYRVSEIRRIKGNVDKKNMKRKRSGKRNKEMNEMPNKRNWEMNEMPGKKDKSHLNKRKRSKTNKLKKALKKKNKQVV